jgi:hypothetical protein
VHITWAEPECPALEVGHLAREVIAGDVELDNPHDFLPAYVLPLMCRGRRPMIMLRSILLIGTLSKFFLHGMATTAVNGVTCVLGVVGPGTGVDPAVMVYCIMA